MLGGRDLHRGAADLLAQRCEMVLRLVDLLVDDRGVVKAVTQHILGHGWIERGAVDYNAQPAPVERIGDLIRMLHVPRLERATAPSGRPPQLVAGQ